jgi:hypothetical protein
MALLLVAAANGEQRNFGASRADTKQLNDRAMRRIGDE